MSGDLPKGWVWSKMLDVLDYEGGSQPPKKEFIYEPRKGYVRLLQIRDFGDKPFPTYVPDSRRLKKARSDDLLLARYGGSSGSDSLGRICTGLEGAYNVALAKIVYSRDLLDHRYTRYLFLGPWFRAKVSQNSRSCQTGFNREDVEDIEFPIAPLAEQKRIVAKVEKLLEKVDASRARLDKVAAILKRFRQSVLAAACSGRLTADWREDKGAEDDLPAGWSWTPLQRLLPKGGIFDGPFGSNLKSSDYTDSGVRVIRLENIGQLRFIGEKETFISREKYANLKKHTVGEGDIIFASFVSGEVRACLLPALSTKAIAKADCFCLRPNSELVDRKYLLFQLVSQKSFNTLFKEIHGATRPRINTTQLRELEIRLCPFPEQLEIVRRVEDLFALADRLEARVGKARGQVEKLTQAILAKAFRGELVPQDPNDEPAEKLLARIQAATGPSATNGGKTASSVAVRRGRARKAR